MGRYVCWGIFRQSALWLDVQTCFGSQRSVGWVLVWFICSLVLFQVQLFARCLFHVKHWLLPIIILTPHYFPCSPSEATNNRGYLALPPNLSRQPSSRAEIGKSWQWQNFGPFSDPLLRSLERKENTYIEVRRGIQYCTIWKNTMIFTLAT